jgi:hypothetical protein
MALVLPDRLDANEEANLVADPFEAEGHAEVAAVDGAGGIDPDGVVLVG